MIATDNYIINPSHISLIEPDSENDKQLVVEINDQHSTKIYLEGQEALDFLHDLQSEYFSLKIKEGSAIGKLFNSLYETYKEEKDYDEIPY